MADCADATDFDSSYVGFNSRIYDKSVVELLKKFFVAIGDKLNNDKFFESECYFAECTSVTVQNWHDLCVSGQKERLVYELKTNLQKALDELEGRRLVFLDDGTSIILCNVFKVGRVQELEPVKKALHLAIRDMKDYPGYDLRSCFVKRKGQRSDSYESMSYAESYEDFLDPFVEFKTHYGVTESRDYSVETFLEAVKEVL